MGHGKQTLILLIMFLFSFQVLSQNLNKPELPKVPVPTKRNLTKSEHKHENPPLEDDEIEVCRPAEMKPHPIVCYKILNIKYHKSKQTGKIHSGFEDE